MSVGGAPSTCPHVKRLLPGMSKSGGTPSPSGQKTHVSCVRLRRLNSGRFFFDLASEGASARPRILSTLSSVPFLALPIPSTMGMVTNPLADGGRGKRQQCRGLDQDASSAALLLVGSHLLPLLLPLVPRLLGLSLPRTGGCAAQCGRGEMGGRFARGVGRFRCRCTSLLRHAGDWLWGPTVRGACSWAEELLLTTPFPNRGTFATGASAPSRGRHSSCLGRQSCVRPRPCPPAVPRCGR